MDIQIRTPSNSEDLKQFIRFDWEVYKNNPCWVPPILQDAEKFLTGKGRFFDHCGHRLFVAKENGKIVAKVAAFYDRNLVGHWNKNIGCLGYFEALPGHPDAVKALLKAAETFLLEQGAAIVWAPINGNIANPAGMLMNAFNRRPFFLMNYNPDYYHAYFKMNGYGTAHELLAFICDLLSSKLQRKVRYLTRRVVHTDISIEKFDRTQFKRDCFEVARIYANTFKRHWGYTPQTEEEVFEILEPMKMAIDPDLIWFAKFKGEVIGFFLTIPDYAPVLQELQGDLGLLNAFRFMRLKRKITEVRGIAIGVKEDWRGKGVGPLMIAAAYNAMIRKGFISMEYSWVHQTNQASQRLAKKFEGVEYKRYCIYGKNLA